MQLIQLIIDGVASGCIYGLVALGFVLIYIATETINLVKDFNPSEIVLLPLYPQYSAATSGSSILEWKEIAKKNHLNTNTSTICCYPQDINLLYTNTYINNLDAKIRIPWRIIRLFVRFYDKHKWNFFDQVICHSKFTAKNIKKHYGVDSEVIYLGTNTNVFFPIENCVKKNTILTLGDSRIRRADLLIKAASELLEKRKDFEIWIVGNSGELGEELELLAKNLNVEKNVKFFGKISDQDLAKLYSESLATVHLVKEAPFGLIVIESMSCGTPVISWKPGGPEETIVDGESGFLIPENNQSDLIEKIEFFLDNPESSYKMGQNGIQRVQTNFDLEIHHKSMRKILLNWINHSKKL